MSLADDWGIHCVTVNCLAPGWFKTAQNAVMYEDQEWVQYLCDRILLKRPDQPPDLEGAIVFLASDASAYIVSGKRGACERQFRRAPRLGQPNGVAD